MATRKLFMYRHIDTETSTAEHPQVFKQFETKVQNNPSLRKQQNRDFMEQARNTEMYMQKAAHDILERAMKIRNAHAVDFKRFRSNFAQ